MGSIINIIHFLVIINLMIMILPINPMKGGNPPRIRNIIVRVNS